MFTIHKQQQPSALIQYKKEKDASYGNMRRKLKSELRKKLLEEQGYICAYCMSRIHNDRFQTKIEHVKSQEKYRSEGLEYSNMLAVCMGGEGNSLKEQHCDTYKGDKELTFTPVDHAFMLEKKIRYGGNGTIRSDDKALDSDLNKALNLNVYSLKEARSSVFSAVVRQLSDLQRHAKRSDIDKLISKWQSLDTSGKRKPYFATAIYFLEKRKQRCSS